MARRRASDAARVGPGERPGESPGESPDERAGGPADLVSRSLRPLLADRRFWAIQAVVLLLAGAHLLTDLHSSIETGAFPGGIPVALLIVPVGYAAVRFGLSGSAATAFFGTVLWLPDLVLPHDQGHAPSDVVNLVLVDAVAIFFGQRIEAERRSHARVERATLGRLRAEAGYRQLFEANRAPILVLDAGGSVRATNPAARALFGDGAIGATAGALVGEGDTIEMLHDRVVTLRDGRDYRVDLVELPDADGAAAQLVFGDVTEERSEARRAAWRRSLMVAAEEEQRRRLARELHDEPLQLLLHLARRLEALSASAGVPTAVAAGLEDARVRSLQAATRLRSVARDLRPPALDQFGLVPTLASFLADVEDDSGLVVELLVEGEARRLWPEAELGAFRIAQEAVRNAVRHAAARHVEVRLCFEADLLRLSVADDGVGFVVADEDDSRAHLGIVGMTERANLLGGQLDVQSAPGQGTAVRASFPVRPGLGPDHRAGARPSGGRPRFGG